MTPNMMKPRQAYKPFEYPIYEEITRKQQSVHWLPLEVEMEGDISDYKHHMTPLEKDITGGILKVFTQTESLIADYWSGKVVKWFPKPEIAGMAMTFSAFEVIHQQGYSLLNDSFGLNDYLSFLQDSETKNKLDNLVATETDDPYEVARSLATFSAFGEGVLLFSSFAVLLSFCLDNKLKKMREIIAWSARDEGFHSEAGCMLFRQLVQECPNIWTAELKKDIQNGARMAIKLEDQFIDKVFEMGDLEKVTKKNLKEFIRLRANNKLKELGLTPLWFNLDPALLAEMEWFDLIVSSTSLTDNFASTSPDYAKFNITYDGMFDGWRPVGTTQVNKND